MISTLVKQRFLNKYNNAGLVEDGLAGKKTNKAIEDFGVDRLRQVISIRLEDNSTLEYINIAKGETGTVEWHGEADNPEVMKYHHSVATWFEDDETPWCASYVNWVMEEAGYTTVNSARALDWLKFGQESEPVFGAISVKTRYNKEGQAVGGHVAFLVAEDKDYYYMLGGNQADSVKISKYRKQGWRGFRVPLDYEFDKYILPKSPQAENISMGGKES